MDFEFEFGKKPEVSGSLIFRDAVVSEKVKVPKGKKLMLVFGVVVVPEDFIEGESMVRVKGFADVGRNMIITEKTGTPIGEKYTGWTVEDLLMQPIWKA